jgi:hypothetical protein
MEGYARAAEENVLNHLLQLHRSLHDTLRRWDVRGDNSEWRSGQSEHLREIELTSHLLPGEELRSRIKEIVTSIYADGSEQDELTKVARMVGISQEGIDLLAAQLRGEPLPPRSAAFIAWRDRPPGPSSGRGRALNDDQRRQLPTAQQQVRTWVNEMAAGHGRR